MMKFTRIVVLLLAVNFGFTTCGSEAKKKPTQQVAIKKPEKTIISYFWNDLRNWMRKNNTIQTFKKSWNYICRSYFQ